MNTQKFDNIELIQQRLRDATAGRKKSDSIASLVETLRKDIETERERGLTWKAIALAILQDEAKQAAIRSAYQRLPSKTPDNAGVTPSRKKRTESEPPSPSQEAQELERAAKTTRFSTEPITDTYGSVNN